MVAAVIASTSFVFSVLFLTISKSSVVVFPIKRLVNHFSVALAPNPGVSVCVSILTPVICCVSKSSANQVVFFPPLPLVATL